jgi:CubicO group peptidase (beta-lactamase class C family)
MSKVLEMIKRILKVRLKQLRPCVVFLTPFALCNCSTVHESGMDKLFEVYIGDSVPGAAVMVIKKGRPIITKTYGMANVEDRIPVTPQSNFRLASVTKQFTAMAIMQLQERGALAYTTTLQEIFPEFPDYGKNITVQNLLQHTSGLIAYEDLIPDSTTVQVLDKDVLQMMIKADSTYFTPGTAFRYSNSGYAVLAMVIEKISGKSFGAFLRDNIFLPLGMDNTIALEHGISQVADRAYGYSVHSDSVEFTDQSVTSAVLGDGGVYSSIEDLYKWDQALYTSKLVSFETMKLALTPELATNGPDSTGYGFGWYIDEYKGRMRARHGGSTRGFRNVIQRFPHDEFTVIILTNRSEPGVESLAEELVDLYLFE